MQFVDFKTNYTKTTTNLRLLIKAYFVICDLFTNLFLLVIINQINEIMDNQVIRIWLFYCFAYLFYTNFLCSNLSSSRVKMILALCLLPIYTVHATPTAELCCGKTNRFVFFIYLFKSKIDIRYMWTWYLKLINQKEIVNFE